MSIRRLPWDWYDGTVPSNVEIDETAYVETSFSFVCCRSERDPAVTIGRGASTYLGTMFDLGPRARVRLSDYVLVHGARIVCDEEITLGDYTVVSWNVVLMDTYRVSPDPARRRVELRAAAGDPRRALAGAAPARPIRIGRNVWIGFDACVLPGVAIGDDAIVGARSVVADDVPAGAVVAGNPARVIRRANPEDPDAR
jgi:serine acetyltransferase